MTYQDHPGYGPPPGPYAGGDAGTPRSVATALFDDSRSSDHATVVATASTPSLPNISLPSIPGGGLPTLPAGGSAPTFSFRSVDSLHTLTGTVHKVSDGKYYIVRVRQT